MEPNHHPEASPGGQYYGEPDGWGQCSVSWLDERHRLAKLDKEERENKAKMEKEERFRKRCKAGKVPCLQMSGPEHNFHVFSFLESPEKLESTNSLQVSDTTDARLLVGLYRCTDLPASLEGIDRAPHEVVAILDHLLLEGILTVPSLG